MQIIWLASYPKSGNTYLRLLLHAYQAGTLRSAEQIARHIPDLHRLIPTGQSPAANGSTPIPVKTHYRYFDEHPHIEASAGFVYVRRNPRDVILSNARYFAYDRDPALLRQFCTEFINRLGLRYWEKMDFGTWPEHLQSWLSGAKHLPHVSTTYEALRTDTANVLSRILKLLGESPDPDRIAKAVEQCSIDRARQFERRERARGEAKLFDQLPNGASFVGDGRMGQSFDFVGADIEALYQEKLGEIAHAWGY